MPEPLKVLNCDIVRLVGEPDPLLLLAMALLWPNFLCLKPASSPIVQALEVAAMCGLQGSQASEEARTLGAVLERQCGWRWHAPAEQIVRSLLDRLLGAAALTIHPGHDGRDDVVPVLDAATQELICAIELLCATLDWAHVYNDVLLARVWPIVGDCLERGARAPDVATPTFLAAGVAAVRLMGTLGSLCRDRGAAGADAAVEQLRCRMRDIVRDGNFVGEARALQVAAVESLVDMTRPGDSVQILNEWRGAAKPESLPLCLRLSTAATSVTTEALAVLRANSADASIADSVAERLAVQSASG